MSTEKNTENTSYETSIELNDPPKMVYRSTIAGNYIYFLYWTFEPEIEFNDKVISAEYLSIDETGEDFQSFLEDVKADENLKCVTRTGYGFSSMLHNSVLNLPIGGDSYIFNSVEDMEAVLSQSMSFSTYQQEDIYFTSQNLV